MKDDELLFKIRMSDNGHYAYLELESKDVITYGILIDALRDLADQLDDDADNSDGRH